MWTAFFEMMTVLSVLSVVGLLGWLFYEVFLRRPRYRGARYEPDPHALRRLQAKRRLALRQLGDRWVLHASQPPVKWGVHREMNEAVER